MTPRSVYVGRTNPVPPDAVVLKADIKPIAEIPRHYRKLPRAQRGDISAAPQLLRRAESVRGRAGFRGAVKHFSKSRPWSVGERTLEVRGLFGPPTTLPQPSEAKVIEINKMLGVKCFTLDDRVLGNIGACKRPGIGPPPPKHQRIPTCSPRPSSPPSSSLPLPSL